MNMFLTILSFFLLGHLSVDYSSIEDYIIKCAKERKTIVLDRDIQITKDVLIYKIKGQGHTINVSEGVTIKTVDDSFSVKDVTFIINEYGNKYGFPTNRGRLIQSTAKNVCLKNIIVKTGRDGEDLRYDETSGWRGRSFLLVCNAENIRISNVTSYNIGMLITYDNSRNAKIKNVIAYNCETNQYIKPTCSHFKLFNVEIKNTKEDKYWVIGGMNGTGTNGKNVILSGAWDCHFKKISGENCIERVIYSIGGGDIKAENLNALNCGGFKFVGNRTEEAEWVGNIRINNCRWVKTESENSRVMLLKSNLSSESNLTVSASNLGIFQIYNVSDIVYDDVYIEDSTEENSSSISNVHSCRNVLLSNWKVYNVRCSRPLVYLTGSMPDNAIITLKNMDLNNYNPSKVTSESVLVGYRTTVPIKERVSVICKNVSINNECESSRDLLGKGITGHSMVDVNIY